MGGKQHGGIFFRRRVIGLGLRVQTGTADGGKCYVVDAMMSTVGVVLDGGMRRLGHTPHTFPLIVTDGLQWKGGKGQTDCTGGLVTDLEIDLSSG